MLSIATRTDLFLFRFICHNAVAARSRNAVERVGARLVAALAVQRTLSHTVLSAKGRCGDAPTVHFRIHCHDAVAARGRNAVECVDARLVAALAVSKGRCRIPCCLATHRLVHSDSSSRCCRTRGNAVERAGARLVAAPAVPKGRCRIPCCLLRRTLCSLSDSSSQCCRGPWR